MRLSNRGRVGAAVATIGLAGAATVSTALATDSPRVESNSFYVYSAAVPTDATATVSSVSAGGTNQTKLQLRGFAPNTTYGAHAHVNACSPTSGAAAGPHYQFEIDPVTPSTNPAYANPQNEIWLDVKTNAAGNGTSKSTVQWTFPADRRAKSVIIHAEPTRTGPTDSGVAGARLACVDVNF